MDAAEMAEAPAPRSTLTQSNPRSSETPNFVVPDFFFKSSTSAIFEQSGHFFKIENRVRVGGTRLCEEESALESAKGDVRAGGCREKGNALCSVPCPPFLAAQLRCCHCLLLDKCLLVPMASFCPFL